MQEKQQENEKLRYFNKVPKLDFEVFCEALTDHLNHFNKKEEALSQKTKYHQKCF